MQSKSVRGGGKGVDVWLGKKGFDKRGVHFQPISEDCSQASERQTMLKVGVSAVQAALAQRIYDKLHAIRHEELLTMSRMMALMPERELYGRGKFELRGKLDQPGSQALETSANARAEKIGSRRLSL
jgi:hypothetical protein